MEGAGIHSQNADSSISRLMEEKEEMAMVWTYGINLNKKTCLFFLLIVILDF